MCCQKFIILAKTFIILMETENDAVKGGGTAPSSQTKIWGVWVMPWLVCPKAVFSKPGGLFSGHVSSS